MKRKLYVTMALFLCIGLAVPVLASEKTDAEKAKERLKTELKAQKERTPQSTCPFSGQPVKEGQGYEYKGHWIGTCSGKCAAMAKKDPLTAIQKIRKNGEEPVLAKGFKRQTECPVMGGPVNADLLEVKDNVLLTFCCAGCSNAYQKDAKGLVQKMLDRKVAPTIVTLEQTACPVSGHKVNQDSSVVHEGKKIYLCCDDCKVKVKADAAKHLQAMADRGIVPEKAN